MQIQMKRKKKEHKDPPEYVNIALIPKGETYY